MIKIRFVTIFAAAMIALTPQTADPTASSDVSLGFSPNAFPRNVMNAIAPAISSSG